MFLYGKNSVTERLRINPKTIRKIFLSRDYRDSDLIGLAKKKGVALREAAKDQLSRIAGKGNSRGVAAEVDDFTYAPLDVLFSPGEKNTSLIFLDRLCDPQNLGSIMRTAACLGGFGIVITRHKACPVTEAVLHVACGAENHVKVAVVSNFPTALIEAKRRGFWVAGAVTGGGRDLDKVSLPFPLCIVFGSEEKGVRYGVDKQLDLKVSIPMAAPLSFNVATAAAMVCYEIAKQRGESKK